MVPLEKKRLTKQVMLYGGPTLAYKLSKGVQSPSGSQSHPPLASYSENSMMAKAAMLSSRLKYEIPITNL